MGWPDGRAGPFFDHDAMTNPNHNNPYSPVTKRVHYFSDLVLQNRFARALEEGIARYPICRELRFAARVELEVLLDAIALDPAWRAERLNVHWAVLDADGMFATAWGSRKAEYCSFRFYIWGAALVRAEERKRRILAKAGSTRITEPMFSIDWHFSAGENELENALIEELADPMPCDAAYPEIRGGVRSFIARYLDAP